MIASAGGRYRPPAFFSWPRITLPGKNPCAGRLATTARAACVLAAVISCAASPSLPQSVSRPDKTVIDTLGTLDSAIRLLDAPSSDYRTVLQDAAAAINTDSRVGAELRKFLARMPSPGPEFQCNTDFVRSRARKALWRLRETARGGNPGPVEPGVCYAAPYAVDVAQVQKPGSLVEIYGYDLDAVTPQVVLVNSDGFEDVTSALVATSHYHLTFNVGNAAVPLSPTSQSLGLAWDHVIRYSIALIQPTTPLCSSRIETVPTGRTVSYLPPVGVEALLARPGTKVWADACTRL